MLVFCLHCGYGCETESYLNCLECGNKLPEFIYKYKVDIQKGWD